MLQCPFAQDEKADEIQLGLVIDHDPQSLICIVYSIVLWPEGSFALIEQIFGCPNHMNDQWNPLVIQFDIANSSAASIQWSASPHFKGPYSQTRLDLHLCVKKPEYGSWRATPWPAGSYCIFSPSNDCPKGEIICQVSSAL